MYVCKIKVTKSNKRYHALHLPGVNNTNNVYNKKEYATLVCDKLLYDYRYICPMQIALAHEHVIMQLSCTCDDLYSNVAI